MKPIVRNILGFLTGLIVGMAANMFFVTISGNVIPLPEGVDPASYESLKAAIAEGKFEFKHYIMPFIAHASQAFIGAFLCTKIAANNEKLFSLIIGGIALLGGIAAANMLKTPAMATAIDLIFAYIPMALLGWKLGMRGKVSIKEESMEEVLHD